MTIRKGEEWGTRIVAPDVITKVGGDRAIAIFSNDHVMSIFKGDLFEALGCPQEVKPGQSCTLLEIDALQCRITFADGTERTELVASCIEVGLFAPRIGRRSRYICISNAGIVNGRNLTPRAHPNDGIFDVLEISPDISFRNRLQAFKRASTGTHIPHPDISTKRLSESEYFNSGGSEVLRIDHWRIPLWQSIHISVLPDYWKIVV